MNRRKAGVILSYAHIIVTNTISLIYTPFMLRVMGQSEYGLYGTAASIVSYLSLLSFGIGGSYVRFNARCRANNDREGEKRLNGMFLTIFSILSVLVAICGTILLIFSKNIVGNTFTAEEQTKLQIIIGILIANMICTFVFNVVTMALNAYEEYFFLRLVLLIVGILTPTINVFALKAGGRAVAISLISFLVSFASYIVFYMYARRKIRLEFSFKGFETKVLKEIVVFSSFLFLNSITDTITFSTDSVVLGAAKGTTCVAVYTVGAQFKNYFHQFATTVSGVFAPSINMKIARHESMKVLDDIFIKVGRIQFFVVSLVLIGYCSIGHDFICIWAGGDYSEAFWIGLCLMLSVYIPSFQSIGIQIQQAMNLHKARSVVYFLVAVVNVIITIPFSIKWGGLGAALATLICLFMGTVVFMNIYYAVKVKLDVKRFWLSIAGILPGMILPIVTGVWINRQWDIDSYSEILFAAIIIAIVYGVSVWCFSMNAYEKALVKKPFVRIFKRAKS